MSTTRINLAFQDGCAVELSFPRPPEIGLAPVRPPSMALDVGTVVYADVSDYTGAYEAAPSADAQVFATDGKRMTGDFTVLPIPSNYGLISWNGSTITVS